MAGVYTLRSTESKAISIDQFPPEAWEIVLGGDSGSGELEKLWKAVPWLNRGVGILSNALVNMPWSIIRADSGEEVDNSRDYQNATGIWDDPHNDLWLMEASMNLFGASYWLKERKGIGMVTVDVGLRYFMPGTIKPKVDASRGLTGFVRSANKTQELFDVDDILYMWLPDPYGEIGAPKWSRALAAMAASDVLMNVDAFAAEFFKRGAIKTTLLRVAGNPPQAERERIKSFWGRVMKGMKTAWENLVVNMDGIEPVTIGEGIGDLGNSELTKEKREDISTALGVPQSMLFSNAANFAVKEGDKRDLYEETVIPDARLIAHAVNKQYLEPMGYRLKFQPEAMDIFMEDEEDRTGAILNLVNSLVNAPSPKIAALVWETLGVELPGDMEYDELIVMLEEANAEKQERAQEIQPNTPAPTLTPAAGTVPDEEDDPGAKSLLLEHLDKWERKAIKRLEKSRTAACPFASDIIPAELNALIYELLTEATTPRRVREIFQAGVAA